MSSNEEIGARVRVALGGRPQVWLAERAGMTTDALSRSLSGRRGFSSIELATVAELLEADLHELVTGRADPHRTVIAARHSFDPATHERSNPGRVDDDAELGAVVLAYQQAYPTVADRPEPWPRTPAEVRALLGADFALHFAARLESSLGVDVIRIQKLSTAYSFTQGGHRVIVLPATGNWWRSNFDLAHELAHLVLGHHAVELGNELDERELAANRFASELLMPESSLSAVAWARASGAQVSQLLWDLGVGTQALALRLEGLGISDLSPAAKVVLQRPMPGAMRPFQRDLLLEPGDGQAEGPESDAFDARMQAASQRRFPRTLVSAHRRRIEEDGLNPGTLAWMLEGPVDDLVDEQPTDRPAIDLTGVFGD